MAMVVQDSSTTSRRTVVISVAGTFVVLLVIGFAFVNSSTMARVARDARALHWVDSVNGTSDLAVASVDHALSGQSPGGSLDRLDETHESLLALAVGAEDYPVYPAFARFVAPLEAVRDELATGNVEAARSWYDTQLSEAHAELVLALSRERASLRASVESGTGITAGWIEFALVLAIPLCVAAAFYIVSRRWVAAVETRSGRQLAEVRQSTAAVSDLVAGLSRDIRAPLTSIYGFAAMMSKGDITGVEAMRETAGVIADEAATMTRIVDDASVASSLDTGGVEVELVETRIGEVVEAAAGPFEQAGVSVRREPSAAMASTDPQLLGHVLTNLLANAVRHGGPQVSVDVSMGKEAVDIEVADNGRGLPESEARAILERMSGEAPILAPGSGLGLAVAGRLTSLMGGSLRYQRYSGRTFFVVTLPAHSRPDLGVEEPSVAEMIKTLSA